MFLGPDDLVRCYYCGLELRKWERADEPWHEHKRYRPDCAHTRLNTERSQIQTCNTENTTAEAVNTWTNVSGKKACSTYKKDI